MADHPNAELLKKGYAAFASGDMATMNQLFAEDVVWHVPGRTPLSGVHRGKDTVFAAFAKFSELTGGTFKIDVHDVVANDVHAVALTRATASRQGKQLDNPAVDIYHISNGQVTEFWSFAEDQRIDDEFWA